MSSMFGDSEKDYIYDEIGYFLERRTLKDLMDVITWICGRYVVKDYESKVTKENTELKKRTSRH